MAAIARYSLLRSLWSLRVSVSRSAETAPHRNSRGAERWLPGFQQNPTAPFAPPQHEHKQDASGPAANVQPAAKLLVC